MTTIILVCLRVYIDIINAIIDLFTDITSYFFNVCCNADIGRHNTMYGTRIQSCTFFKTCYYFSISSYLLYSSLLLQVRSGEVRFVI